jgi:hypothetical protein
MVKKLGATVAVALLLATSACGGGRPSADELSTSMQTKGVTTNGRTVKLTKDQADCAAKIFVNSDLSDEALQAIADSDETYKASKQDDAALKKITDDLGACATKE